MMTGRRPAVEEGRKYSLTEAARLLGVSRPTVCRWRRLGIIRFAVWKGTRIYYTAKDITDCWEDGR